MLFITGVCALLAADDPTAALTNEDIVRMVADHVTAEAIIKAIRSAPSTAFDLDPDVVIELRRAGVPDGVIDVMEAMEAKAKAQRAASAAVPAETKPHGTIELVFEKDERGDVQKSTATSEAKDWNDRPVSLSFFLLCVDPLHVPDLWDTKTPLREFFPRHHLLWFLEATRPWRENRRGGSVYLELPRSAPAEVEAATHSLMLGVAGRIGDTPWQPVAFAEAKVDVKTGETVHVFVRVRTLRAGRLNLAPGSAPLVTCAIDRIEPRQGSSGGPDPNGRPQAP